MFKTKKELLEYLWKKGNDNKLVDRLMLKGIVEKVDGWYILHDPDKEEIERLKWMIQEKDILISGQDREIRRLKSENEWLVVENAELMQESIKEWEKKSDVDIDMIINVVHKYLVQVCHVHVDKSDFRERVERNLE